MKSKEEIEKMAEDYARNDYPEINGRYEIKKAFTVGHTKCAKDMEKLLIKLSKKALDKSITGIDNDASIRYQGQHEMAERLLTLYRESLKINK